MTVMTMAQALNSALDIALSDPRVVVMGEDIGTTGGVFRITDGLQQKHGAERVIDTPVAESGIVGAAFGMAVAGIRPIVEIQFMGFSYPAYDQVINHVARIRNRSRHRFTAPMVIRLPYGAGIGAAEHHSESTEAIYAHIPGLKVVVASTPENAKGLLLAAVDDPDPVMFMEPIRLYRAARGEVPAGRHTTPIGAAAVERNGSDVSLVSYGAMMRETREAADRLAGEGVSAEVIDVRTLVPLDADTIVSSVAKTGRAVISPRSTSHGWLRRRDRGADTGAGPLLAASTCAEGYRVGSSSFPCGSPNVTTCRRSAGSSRRPGTRWRGEVAREFHLPDVGEGLVEAVIVSWYVEVGAAVGLDEPLVEVETDKAIVDIPSPYAGVLLHRGGEDGETVEVDSLLAVIGEPGETWAEAPETPQPDQPRTGRRPWWGFSRGPDPGVPGRPLALPFVRKLADELGVDLSGVSGSGPLGRITEADVRAAASTRSTVRIPMSRLRRTISEGLSRSWREIPHVTTYGDADSERLMAERERLGKPPVEALLIARLVPVLVRFPRFNSAVEGDDIVERRFYDIGFAVDTPDGLMVAVVHDADTLSIEELAGEVRRLVSGAERADVADR